MDTVDLSSVTAVEAVPGVFLAALAAGENASVQHVHVEPDAEIPEHDHPHEQVGFVYDGALRFEVGEEEFVVGTGESYAIPGGEPHAVECFSTEAARAIDVFSPPRVDPDWKSE